MKYRITYEVVKEVDATEIFPIDVMKKNLIDLKANETLPNWLVTGEKTISVKVKSFKEVNPTKKPRKKIE